MSENSPDVRVYCVNFLVQKSGRVNFLTNFKSATNDLKHSIYD